MTQNIDDLRHAWAGGSGNIDDLLRAKFGGTGNIDDLRRAYFGGSAGQNIDDVLHAAYGAGNLDDQAQSYYGVKYLLGPFRFATDQAAPLPATYTEAGAVGSLAVTDTGNKLSVSAGALQVAAAVGSGDPRVYASSGLARAAGRTALARVTVGAPYLETGFTGDAAGNTHQDRLAIHATQRTVFANGTGIPLPGTLTVGATYDVAVVLRGAGAFFLARGGELGANWVLLWVGDAGAPDPVYAGIRAGGTGATGALGDWRVTDLPAPFGTAYGLATSRLAGARAQGDTYAHSANALIEFTATTLPSAGSLDVRFRAQDTGNYWVARVSSAGALSLIEVVAGVETSRGSAATAVANGQRVVVVADGATLTGYANNAQKWSYTSATGGQAATAGSVASLGTGGAVSDLIAWPRTVALPNA